jgi:hypothetical protein
VARHPSEHRLVHPLPRAPQFVGRDAELAALRELWQAGTRGVVALVGQGGAGKTAIAVAADVVARGSPQPQNDG